MCTVATHLLRDARFGLRLLLKNPGFTAVATLTLALGIAANTAIFSVVHATFFAPLPYREADRLVMLWSQIQGYRNSVSPGDFVEWKRQATTFEDLNAWTGRNVNLSSDGRPEQVEAGVAAPGFLPMLGYGHPLALGRDFLEEEGTVGKDQVAILSHRLWQERFGGDRGIIGRHIRLDGKPYIVVGILGAGPGDRIQYRLWLPLAFTPDQLNHESRFLTVMGRLKPGVTLEQANANMHAVARNLAKTYPTSNTGWSVSVEPFRNNFLSDSTKNSLWMLLGAVAFVLLIACANVANLLLARGTVRQREVAVRTALGASRAEIARQLITESLVLAVIGSALGVAIAAGLMRAILALMPTYMLPSETDVRLNVPVMLFTLAACGLSGILFGCAPAWQVARTDINETLKEAGRSVRGGRHGLRQALVVVEFALALTLLTGGGLAIHSLVTLTSTDLGFRTDRLLTFSLPVQPERLTGTEEINSFYRQLVERIQAVPGVMSAAVATGIPLRGGFGVPFSIVGQPVDDPSQRPGARFNRVSADYFETFGMRITRGRAFTEQDGEGSVPVAIVNETLAKRHFGNADPLTQRLVVERRLPGATKPEPGIEWQIVGVSADVRSAGPKDDVRPEIHVPFWQRPWPQAGMAIRTAGDPMSVQRSIAAVIHSMDPDLPMANVRTMEQIVDLSFVSDRFNTALFGSFAAVALLLAAFGIYGVMSFAVAQRTHEIGLRIALGAGRGRVLWQVLREGMTTAVLGTVLGSAGAYFVVRAMHGMVFGVALVAPTAFIIVALSLLGAALLACLVPATRAASVDPMVALRQE